MNYVKAVAIVFLVAFGYVIGVWHTDDKWNAEKANQAQATATAVLVEHTADQAELKQEMTAEDIHADDLKEIALPSTHTVPVFVLHSPVCPSTVPRTAAEAASEPAATRPVDPGFGIDLRVAIDAFERKYETALSECRLLDAAWPKTP